VAQIKYLSKFVGRWLKDREELIGAIRVTPRGNSIIVASLAGAGVVIGYVVTRALSDDVLALAFGVGVGAAGGMSIGSAFGYLRMRQTTGIRSSTVWVALSKRRLLIFTRSWLSNRPAALAREIPIGAIASIEAGEARLLAPHAVTIDLADGGSLEFEAARVEKPRELEEAFREATGR
jgi:hypothetical protein